MIRKILPFVLLAVAAPLAFAAPAKGPTTLKSVSLTFPKDTTPLPDGPNVAVVRNNCTGCHSPSMILYQPTMPKAGWEAEVNKMKNVYKAPLDPKDMPAIVDYLTAVKGPK